MPESAFPRQRALAVTAALALTALGLLGGAPAWLGGVLAQPAWALALSSVAQQGWAQRRSLLLLWALTALAASAGLWLAHTLLDERWQLLQVWLVGLVLGVGVLLLWRVWPLWQRLERDGGALRARRRALDNRESQAWRGLLVVAAIVLVTAWICALAWPGLWTPLQQRWLTALAVLGWPAAHWTIRRVRAADVRMHAISALSTLTADAEASVVANAPDITVPPPQATHTLYTAARIGRTDLGLAALANGADVHALPQPHERDQRSVAVLAAVLPDIRLLRGLIEQGVDLNAVHAGLTPLLAATRDSWHGRPEAVMTLLTNGANPRIADGDGNTPLHHAARSTDPAVSALLLDAAADIDARNHAGVTPLGQACASGNWRLARFLLERGAMPQVPGATPALIPAAGGDEDDPVGIQLLLRHRAQANAVDAQGRSALHEAARMGYADNIAALLQAGALVDARDDNGNTPLQEAAQGGHLAAVQALLQAGADASVTDAQGRHLAVLAAAGGHWALVPLLDPAFPMPASRTVQGSDDRVPIALARDALDEGDYTSAAAVLPLLDDDERDALLLADGQGVEPAVMEWLLAHGARPDAAVQTLLAEGRAALPALHTLFAYGGSPAGRRGLARWLTACLQQPADRHDAVCQRFAIELLERGADPFAATDAGTPLMLAIRLGWMELVDRLIAAGVDLNACNALGITALRVAIERGDEDLVRRLVVRGAATDMRGSDGQTPLGQALASGQQDIVRWLHWRGWVLPVRPLRATDLPAAATVGDSDAVRRLLAFGFPIDTRDTQGCTALLRAAGGGHIATVDLLLAQGADPTLASKSGATPLSAAVSMRHLPVIDRLLAKGAPIDQRLPGGMTVLMLAAGLGQPDLCARLLAAGADVHTADDQGLTPMHCAALHGFGSRERPRLLALLDTLLLSGADADAEAMGVTPLLMLLGARGEPGSSCDENVLLAGVLRLLDENVRLDVRDPRGFGPLHLAALHGLLRTVGALLRAGADLRAQDGMGRTPRDVAIMRGFVDVAGELTQQTGIIIPSIPKRPVSGATSGTTDDGKPLSLSQFLRDRS